MQIVYKCNQEVPNQNDAEMIGKQGPIKDNINKTWHRPWISLKRIHIFCFQDLVVLIVLQDILWPFTSQFQ